MSFQIKQGTTAYNPRVITDGLIFYVDPNNARCRTSNEDRFVSLIQPFNNIPNLSAGILVSNTNTLTSVEDNFFIELSGVNSLSGNIGPGYALSALEDFTLQFWFKNNKPVNQYTNIFSNVDTTIPLLTASGLTITLSTNYPYSEEFGTQGINGQYRRQSTSSGGRVLYQRRFPDNTSTRPFRIVWSGSKWLIANGLSQAIHFESNEDQGNPLLVQNWNLVLTSFRFNIGNIPVEFFNTLARPSFSNDSKIQYNFYPILSTNTGESLYLQKPVAVGSQETLPQVQRPDYNTPWALKLLGSLGYDNAFVADSLAEYPWQPITYSPNFSALSASSDIYFNNFSTGSKQTLSGWYFYYGDSNDRPIYWRSDVNFQTSQYNELYIQYITPLEDPGINVPGWYIIWYDVISYSYILSSDNTTDKPWEIDNWQPTNDRTYTSLTTSFSSIFYNIPPITAVPIYPEDFSNITLILSGDLSLVTERPGYFLSGTNNTLSFTYRDNDPIPPNDTLFNTNTGVWNCVTLAQSDQEVTLYKNSSIQNIIHTETKYFNLSSMYFGNNITLGQVFLYNRYLPYKEVRQNYNSFKSRYKTDDVFPPPSIFNWILNSKFDADNQYPIYDGSRMNDGNYFSNGPSNTSNILTNYIHNSPLLFEYDNGTLYSYFTFANRTFHEINSPYAILPIGHDLQPRLLKMFGVGSRLGVPNTFYGINGNNLRTIINTTSFSPTNIQSWVKYGVAQYVSIPRGATKVVFGVSYLVKSSDSLRTNNFGGLSLSFRRDGYRSYVNIYVIHNTLPPFLGPLLTLQGLYNTDTYSYFNANFGQNAMCQWMGPNTSRVKVRRLAPFNNINVGYGNLFDKFNTVSFMVDIPTFSATSDQPEPDFGNGFAQDVCLEMFFAESLSLLNDDGIDSGSIYFYEPFLYFK